jgi:hypothetical protein
MAQEEQVPLAEIAFLIYRGSYDPLLLVIMRVIRQEKHWEAINIQLENISV